MSKTFRLMQEYNIIIQVINLYNYRRVVFIEYFNKTLKNSIQNLIYY